MQQGSSHCGSFTVTVSAGDGRIVLMWSGVRLLLGALSIRHVHHPHDTPQSLLHHQPHLSLPPHLRRLVPRLLPASRVRWEGQPRDHHPPHHHVILITVSSSSSCPRRSPSSWRSSSSCSSLARRCRRRPMPFQFSVSQFSTPVVVVVDVILLPLLRRYRHYCKHARPTFIANYSSITSLGHGCNLHPMHLWILGLNADVITIGRHCPRTQLWGSLLAGHRT